MRVALLCGAFALTCAGRAQARMGAATSVAGLAASASRVFRGTCVAVEAGTVEVAGGRLPATTYTFQVGEHLKGRPARTITFRQLGTPDGGPRDLGRLADLPTYAPGTEYVLFLLPASRAGLTSPAGAAEGAFVVRDGEVRSLRGSAGDATHGRRPAGALARASYEELRRAVKKAMAP